MPRLEFLPLLALCSLAATLRASTPGANVRHFRCNSNWSIDLMANRKKTERSRGNTRRAMVTKTHASKGVGGGKSHQSSPRERIVDFSSRPEAALDSLAGPTPRRCPHPSAPQIKRRRPV